MVYPRKTILNPPFKQPFLSSKPAGVIMSGSHCGPNTAQLGSRCWSHKDRWKPPAAKAHPCVPRQREPRPLLIWQRFIINPDLSIMNVPCPDVYYIFDVYFVSIICVFTLFSICIGVYVCSLPFAIIVIDMNYHVEIVLPICCITCDELSLKHEPLLLIN